MSPGAVHANREGRERAITLLYEAESRGADPAELLDDQVVSSEFAREAVRGVDRLQEQIDALIAAKSKGWALNRLAAVDRAVLRLGTWELMEHEEASVGVILSEAVELAGQYSTAESKRFVNGLLAAIAAEVRPG